MSKFVKAISKRSLTNSFLGKVAFGTSLAASALMAGSAQAAPVVYNFYYDSVISAGKPVTSLPGSFLPVDPTTGKIPVFSATFTDAGTGKVNLTVATNFSDPKNFIDDIGFNFTNSITGLAIDSCSESVNTICAPGDTSLVVNPNGVSVNGGGSIGVGFDFLVDFPPPPGSGGNPGPKRLGGSGETITLTLKSTNPGGLAPGDFFTQTSNLLYTSAHIQGLAVGGSTNIVGTPPGNTPPPPAPGDAVPGPLPLLGAAAAFGYSRKLRGRIKATHQFKPIANN